MRDLVVVLLLAVLTCAAGLEAKWTPNGEAPAPYSTKARQAMGMDPAAMAGMAGAAAAPVSPGGTLKFNLGCLLVVYLCNNWKIVLAVQELVVRAVPARAAQARTSVTPPSHDFLMSSCSASLARVLAAQAAATHPRCQGCEARCCGAPGYDQINCYRTQSTAGATEKGQQLAQGWRRQRVMFC